MERVREAFLVTLFAGLLYAASAFGQVATIPVISDRNNEPHDYSYGPIVVPTGVNFVRFIFDSRDQLKHNATITVVCRISLNGGMTDQPCGGDVFGANKQPADFFVQIPEPANEGRILSGRITLFGDKWKGTANVLLEQ